MFPVLIDRLGAANLEGYEHIADPKMKPTPSQKPQVMVKHIEESEEVRLQLAELVTIMV